MAGNNNVHRGPARDKPYRDAIRMEAFAEIETPVPKRSLRAIARALLDRAAEGDVGAAKEVGDRLDGKVPQTLGQSEEHEPLQFIVTGVPRSTDDNA